MTAVLTSGYEHSGFSLVHRILLNAGLAQATPSRREQLSATDLQAKLMKSMGRPLEEAIASLHPGRLWNELAVDLFLGNMDVPAWGWADGATMPLLDFWHEFDANTRFVLVFSPLEFAIGQALQGKRATKEALESVTRQWTMHSEAIVRFMKRNPGRCEVVNVVGALHAPGQLVRRLAQRWSLPLQLPADFVPERQGISLVAASLARGAVGDRDDVLALYEEMEVLAGLDGDASCIEEELLAWNEYSEERSAHEAAVLHVARLEERLAQAAVTERELQGTITGITHQLESMTTERRQVQEELVQHKVQLEQLANERDAQVLLLTERFTQIQMMEQRLGAAQAEIAELERDSHLLREAEEELAQRKHELERVTSERDTHSGLVTEQSARIQAMELDLSAVQKKLEQCQQDNALLREVEQALARTKRELEQLKSESAKQLEAARTRSELDSSGQLERSKEMQQENELLLIQLHQVQEELEHYYLQNQELVAKAGRDNRLMQFFRDNQPAEVIIDLRGEFEGENWYLAEDDGRWAGPKTTSSVKIPALLPGQYAMEIDVVDAMSPEIVTEMDVYVNGVHVPTEVDMQSGYPARVVGSFSTAEFPSDTHWCFELRFKNLMSPIERGESDERTLAVRAKTIALILEAQSRVQ